jgi:outer membrane protein assembly factor BamA
LVNFGTHWIFTTSYDLEFSDPFNIQPAANTDADQARKKRLTAATEDVLVEYVDDSFSPQKGSRSKLSLNLYDKRLGGNVSFWLTSARETIYLPVWTIKKNRVLGFSLSLNGGISGPYEETAEVPVEKRFRVGGENSVRGYGENAINPAGFEGGDSFFSFMSELYIPVAWGVDFLGFFDGGSAFKSNGEFHPWDLRYGVGPGIRWNTPVGPLKFGYGFILGRKTDTQGNYTEPMGHFYFGVGAL